ncbi:Uncharacterized protein dnm_025790 [Desulfonema magnum]|uniref:Uncharacterized protein n=1 Tax=Desulfonema magnum TaxID=45655 RepID=A0A975BJK1_9BACT|nr:Uncharacterized protein dnm_025790 [Desulfonema magnum]
MPKSEKSEDFNHPYGTWENGAICPISELPGCFHSSLRD